MSVSGHHDGTQTESQTEQPDQAYYRQPSIVDSEGDSLLDQSVLTVGLGAQSKSVKTILSQLLPSGPMITPILVGCEL